MRPELGQEENHEKEEEGQEEAPFKGLFVNLTSLVHMLNFVLGVVSFILVTRVQRLPIFEICPKNGF